MSESKIAFSAKALGPITYRSSDKSVFTIAQDGTITLEKPGIAYIYVRAGATKQYAAKRVRVKVTVRPRRGRLIRLKSTRKGLLYVRWQKDTDAYGYQIQISPYQDFRIKYSYFRSSQVGGTALRQLPSGKAFISGKKWFVRVRTYVRTGNKRLYGPWSKEKIQIIA